MIFSALAKGGLLIVMWPGLTVLTLLLRKCSMLDIYESIQGFRVWRDNCVLTRDSVQFGIQICIILNCSSHMKNKS
jgi:hypothetical protein